MNRKFLNLKNIIGEFPRLAIAFSGGTDSTLLAKTATEVLGDNILLIHARSELVKQTETDFVQQWAEQEHIRLEIFDFNPFSYPDVRKNDHLRCYHCKKAIMGELKTIAETLGFNHIADGANADDVDDYRPGIRAADELGVIHPFMLAGMNKNDIRRYSREYGLLNWDTPAAACLASRIQYGVALESHLLKMIEQAEEYLEKSGFPACRVRYVDHRAEIEINPSFFRHIIDLSSEITDTLKSLGFEAVLLNLEGYKQGSLNRSLKNLQETQL
jgi:uncharacterized protein